MLIKDCYIGLDNGIKPKACLPGRPKTRGKVENPFFYPEQHFIKYVQFKAEYTIIITSKKRIGIINIYQGLKSSARLLNGIFLILKYGKMCQIDRICDFNKKVENPIFLYKKIFMKKGRSIHEKILFISFLFFTGRDHH